MRLSGVILLASFLGTLSSATSLAAPARPPITSISSISVYTTDPAATEHFYVFVLGFGKGPDPENASGQRYYLNPTQFVEVLPLPPGKEPTSLDHVGYVTSNARAMRVYLAARGVTVPAKLTIGSDGSRWFRVKDPEGNIVEFMQNSPHPPSLPPYNPIGHHMIHVGFLIHSRETEDRFYREILGFRPYWYGGMQTGRVDWVSQQVPDGRDWLEYMLTSGPSGSGIPAEISPGRLGVLNHFSIGVKTMSTVVSTLTSAGRLSPHRSGPQIGRDGKWQYNLFDPDGTRVELMEFQNVREPCCSPFTAENPNPK